MPAAARYLVHVPPGAYVAGVGFVKMGDIFTAPSDDYVPSRRFRAMNAEAAAALGKLKAEILKKAEEAKKEEAESHALDMKQALRERAKVLAEEAAKIVTELFAAEPPRPPVEPGFSMRELDEMSRGPESKAAAVEEARRGVQPAGKRAADR